MESLTSSVYEKKEKSKNKRNIEKIKSKFFFEKIFSYLSKGKSLNILKYNKKYQKILNIKINDYKYYNETFTPIEIEIMPLEDIYGKFINFNSKQSYFHIYFNDSNKEMKRSYFTEDDKVKKLK